MYVVFPIEVEGAMEDGSVVVWEGTFEHAAYNIKQSPAINNIVL